MSHPQMLGMAMLLALGTLPRHAAAQIDEGDTLAAQLRVQFSGYRQWGNVDLAILRGGLDYSWRPAGHWVFKSQNTYLYQAFYGNMADNDLHSRNYLYHGTHRRVYPYLIAFVAGNHRRNIRHRVFGGAGGTWQILRKPGHSIKLSANAVYESTHFAEASYNLDTYNGNSHINLWRASVYSSGQHHFKSSSISFSYEAFFQPALRASENYRIQADLSLAFKVWKGLSVNATYLYRRESFVVEDIAERDAILSFGLSYHWAKSYSTTAKQAPKA